MYDKKRFDKEFLVSSAWLFGGGARNKNSIEYTSNRKLFCCFCYEIMFLWEDYDKFIRSYLTLSGKSYVITSGKGKSSYKSLQGHLCDNPVDDISYILLDICDDKYHLLLEDAGLRLKGTYDQYTKISEFYKLTNCNHIKQEKNNKKVMRYVNRYLKDNDTIKQISNFILNKPNQIFLNPELIIQVEGMISFNYRKFPNTLLWSDELKRANYCKIEVVMESGINKCIIKFKNDEMINSYFDNGFNLLIEIMVEKYGEERHLLNYTLYMLVNKAIKEKFSREWQDEYGENFTSISEINLENTISIFLSLDLVESVNSNVTGKFIYYLMKNEKFEANNEDYLKCYEEFINIYQKKKKLLKIDSLKKELTLQYVRNENSVRSKTIDDIDLMDGGEFEQFIANLFEEMGFKTKLPSTLVIKESMLSLKSKVKELVYKQNAIQG